MKKLGLITALTGLTCAAAQAFSLLGPWTDWQTLDLGYQLDTEDPNNPTWDAGGPMNLKEGYRWNIPAMTYAFDKSFMDYYGEKGVEEIERAIATINDAFAHMYEDNYLDSIPTSVARYNYRAAALGLEDLYSETLSFLTEKLGLGPAERYCWTLRSGTPPTDDSIGMYYTIRRNFDPETLEPTPYVNGVLYSYRINFFGDDGQYAEALEITPDPTAVAYTSVSGRHNNVHQMIPLEGLYYTGLSRDDVGGLRWLYSADNYAFEGTTITGAAGSAGILTPQYTAPVIVTNLDLAQFLIAVERTTNTADQVLALYPGLNIISTNWDYETIKTTNYVYAQTSPWMPYGQVPVLVPQVENHFRLLYTYGYDNVITNFGGQVTKDKLQYIIISSGAQMSPWLPYGTGTDGTAVTNYINISTNRVTGGIMILGGLGGGNVTTNDNATNVANNAGGYEFLATNFVRRIYVTNLIASANSDGTGNGTNDNGGTTIGIGLGDDTGGDTGAGTNVVSASFNQYMVTSYDLYEYLVYPIVWSDGGGTDGGDDTNAVATSAILYRPGLAGNFRLQRVNFDNLIGSTFTPTNMYFSNIVYMKMKDNVNDPVTDPYGQLDVTTIRRQLSWPDIVFTAKDLGPVTPNAKGENVWMNHATDNTAQPNAAGTATLAGPGVITSMGGGIDFNTIPNDVWMNDTQGPLSLFEQNNGRLRYWASFDGSTNAPHLYPATGTMKTIQWLEQQITNSVPVK